MAVFRPAAMTQPALDQGDSVTRNVATVWNGPANPDGELLRLLKGR
jgi:hypothetical protein